MTTRISKEQFDYVCGLARENAAIVLEAGKEYLVETRLSPLARSAGFDSLSSLIDHMRNDGGASPLRHRAVEALTTNETLFFRDFHPFEALEKSIIPEAMARKASQRKLSIWSAACSTGQEPYSLAMLLKQRFPQLAGWTVEIIATDINTAVLEKAKSGTYSQLEVNRGLPLPMLAKYFSKVADSWELKPEIRGMVSFQPLNLIRPWPRLPSFDLVLMRNVLIYFDVPTKRTILERIKATMGPSAALFLGASETTINIDPAWEIVSCGKSVYYRPKAAAAAKAMPGRN